MRVRPTVNWWSAVPAAIAIGVAGFTLAMCAATMF